ncbi:MAG TPA: tRNA preQ1(34) S-adenosylmethionine ribosyltransferase-isomerase QueA [Candidatus Saccharimonadales bacterium]|nr:tRNA preQ1(34) S-adenosylmethionine ribosyltransferase-isomerase QueA [Candidatus Saccharimonadales bacterium]
MKLSDFDFDLPQHLSAQTPARPRNHARLLIYDRSTKQIIDDYFYNLEKYLPRNTTLVLNNSKVEKARLRFGPVEVFILETINPTTVRAMVRPGRKFKQGISTLIDLDGSGSLEVKTTAIDEQGIRTLELGLPLDDPALDAYRLTPLPPYIKQDESLADEYQTVYADPLGSKAAPTAGLHFTAEQLADIKKSHDVAELTLHVGLGTFAPVKSENIDEHVMHHEWYEVTAEAAKLLNDTGHLTAVGTTSARTLESLNRPFKAASGETNIFIKPGYQFKNVDAIITNFHLPKSTLLMMISALIGSVDELHRIYRHAIDNGYRFYSFGDAMLII